MKVQRRRPSAQARLPWVQAHAPGFPHPQRLASGRFRSVSSSSSSPYRRGVPLVLACRFVGLGVLAVSFIVSCSLKVDRDRLAALGAPCDGGVCSDAADPSAGCRSGCWDDVALACIPGTSNVACGREGAACTACEAPTGLCAEGLCVAQNAVLALSASAGHTCMADSAFNLWCWGQNDRGQLGLELGSPGTDRPQISATGSWKDVSAGGEGQAHTCAIHFQGSLWCWGDNSRGQVGANPSEVPFSSRVRLLDPGGWARVSVGPLASCAVRDQGTLWCWGAGDDGRLGFEGGSDRPGVVGTEADWRDVSVGDGFSCALKDDNSLYCWGRNDRGQVGRSDVGAVTSRPAFVTANVLSVAAGGSHACGVRTGNSVWCWGDNAQGQSAETRELPFVPSPRRLAFGIAPEPQWRQVAAGVGHSCAVSADGQLWCWGRNDEGQIGMGAASALPSPPVRIARERGWRRVAVGARHTCAEAADGTLWCWGDGRLGQTGVAPPLTPIPVRVTF